MRWRDIQAGRVDLARLAEQRGGWLGAWPAQDPMSEAIDEQIGTRRLVPTPCPVVASDFDAAGMGSL